MIIEKLKKEDIEQYKELIDEAFESSNSLTNYNNYDISQNNYEIIVAKKNKKIIGSITMYKIDLFTFSFQPMLELFNVAVLKEYRKQHVAQTILKYIIQYAKDNNYKSICLTCLDSAISAHKLYESVGMKKANSVKYNLYL